MPAYVGSSKNLLPERQRNAQQDTETQWSLLVFRCLGAKERTLKLGGFTYAFAEITDENELGIQSLLATEPESTDNLTPCLGKVKHRKENLSFFSFFSRVCARLLKKGAERNKSGKIHP